MVHRLEAVWSCPEDQLAFFVFFFPFRFFSSMGVSNFSKMDGPNASPLVQHAEFPTAFPCDCRYFKNCAPRGGLSPCKRPQDLAKAGEHLGKGPSLAGGHNAHYSGGFVEPGSLYVAAYWAGLSEAKGAIVKVALETGERTLVSGVMPSGEEAGSGHAFCHVIDVQRGPDGSLFAFVLPNKPSSHEIVAIDEVSGGRCLVWKGRDERFGQLVLADGKTSVQYSGTGFAVDKDGSFLVGISHPQSGRGLVRISSSGETVVPVSVFSSDQSIVKGKGNELRGFLQGYTLRDDKLFAFTTQPKQFLEIDLATGDRTVLISGNAAGAMGERWALWDETYQVWWLCGFQNSVCVVAFDPKTKKTFNAFKGGGKDFTWFPLGAGGPFAINSLNYGGVWKHPDHTDRLLLAHDSVAIVELEISSGNSRVLSL